MAPVCNERYDGKSMELSGNLAGELRNLSILNNNSLTFVFRPIIGGDASQLLLCRVFRHHKFTTASLMRLKS